MKSYQKKKLLNYVHIKKILSECPLYQSISAKMGSDGRSLLQTLQLTL